jgi:hypothetical protein
MVFANSAEVTKMRLFSKILILAAMMSPLYPQQLPDPESLLSKAELGEYRIRANADDRMAIYQLAKAWMVLPMTDFKALSARNQKIVIQAANQSFKGEAYLDMVANILQAVVDGDIPPEVGKIAFESSDGLNEWTLAVNHTDPRIAEVLPKLLDRYRDDEDSSGQIRDLISGKAKRDVIGHCKEYGLRLPQVITRSPSNTAPPSPNANTISIPEKAPEQRPVPTAPAEGSPSGMSWSILALMIIAATGLLWWLLRRRSGRTMGSGRCS